MDNSNRIKNEKLGMSHGTAASRLRKQLLFKYVKLAGDNVCHRCNKDIDSERELSVEHVESWLRADNPYETFFDINNIRFSHLSCNSAASYKPHQKYFSKEERRQADLKQKRERYHANKIKSI